MGNFVHKTIPLLVWADIDEGIANMVRYLNTIPGVRTHYSCQGTIGEGGPHPYPPQVGVSWSTDEALARIVAEFDVDQFMHGDHWADIHPRDGWVATAAAPDEAGSGRGE